MGLVWARLQGRGLCLAPGSGFGRIGHCSPRAQAVGGCSERRGSGTVWDPCCPRPGPPGMAGAVGEMVRPGMWSGEDPGAQSPGLT